MTKLQWMQDVISYNRQTPLGSIYDDQFVFVQMHRYFDNFISVGTLDEPWTSDYGYADKSFTLKVERKKKSASWKMASSKEFIDLIKGMPKRKFILYSPLDPPYKVNPLTYIMNSPTIAHTYEHKRYFRDEFSDLINMPEYTILRLDELTASMYKELKDEYKGKFVIQDVESSGSKGTFIIRTVAQYMTALENLKKTSFSGYVVVSEYITGLPCSVQVCITKYGIFTGGLQRQLVDSKYLCNMKLDSVSRWCGGELGGETSEIIKHRTQEIATVVGTELASHGYRGIFGIDLIITPENDVYAIEINARITGYSHVLSDMQYDKSKIPFMLLHTLELGNYKYEIDDLEALPSMNSLDEKYSYMILNNLTDDSFKLKEDIRTGLYRIDGKKITFIKRALSVSDIKDDNYFIINSKYKKGSTIEKGKRILKVIKRGGCMTEYGDLDLRSQKLIQAVKNHFSIPG